MLSDTVNSEESSKVIKEKNQPLMFDSGNPFMFTQSATFEDDSVRIIDEKSQNTIDNEIELTQSFFDEQIRDAMVRIEKYKDNPYVFNNVGLAFMNRGDYDEATKYFDNAITLEPKFRPALLNLAKTLFMQKDFSKAIEIYNKLNEYYPEDTKVLVNLAHAYFNKKELDKAEELLLRVVRMDAKNASAYNNLGVINLFRNEINKALSYIRRALQINDRFANAYNNMGLCFENQKKYKKAINSYFAAISINNNLKAAFKNLAYSYQEIEEYEKSFDVIKRYHSMNNPDFESYDIAVFSLFQLKQYKRAIGFIAKALKDPAISMTDKGKAHFYNNLAVLFERLNKFEEVDNYYLTSLSMDTSNITTFNNLINSLLRKNEVLKAKEYVDKVKTLFPNTAQALYIEGKYLYHSYEHSTACSLLNEAMKLDPKFIDSYALLNHILTDTYERYTDAIEIAKEGLKYEPKNIFLLNNLAYTYLLDNRVKDAREILDNVEEDEDSLHITATRGLLLIKEGNLDEGERLYNKAIFLAGSDKDLMKRVKQKKYLELAGYYYNQKDYQLADRNIKKAMNIKVRFDIFGRAIKKLSESINLAQ